MNCLMNFKRIPYPVNVPLPLLVVHNFPARVQEFIQWCISTAATFSFSTPCGFPRTQNRQQFSNACVDWNAFFTLGRLLFKANSLNSPRLTTSSKQSKNAPNSATANHHSSWNSFFPNSRILYFAQKTSHMFPAPYPPVVHPTPMT